MRPQQLNMFDIYKMNHPAGVNRVNTISSNTQPATSSGVTGGLSTSGLIWMLAIGVIGVVAIIWLTNKVKQESSANSDERK